MPTLHVSEVSLVDFRAYARAEVALDSGVTVLSGANGQGKTNFVEALGYAATLTSHRVATDAPLIRIGAQRAVVRLVVRRDARAARLEFEIAPGRGSRARVNGAAVPRPRDALGVLRVVVFAPEDLSLVKGDPSERRRFLDDLLVLRYPRFAGVRQDYDRALRQRNALLRSAGPAIRAGRAALPTLDVWDGHLARAGADLLLARLQLVDVLSPLVDKAYDAVSSGAGPTALDYRCSAEIGGGDLVSGGLGREDLTSLLLEAMGSVRRQELERGVSLVGPHRDDLVLKLGPAPARGYASQGESWSLALALRLAAFDLLRGEAGPADGGDPVLVLDDVFAELDEGRRDRLAGLVSGAEQVLVTASVPADVPPALRGGWLRVANGEVARVR